MDGQSSVDTVQAGRVPADLDAVSEAGVMVDAQAHETAAVDYYAEAVGRLQSLLDRAGHCGLSEPTAATLATADTTARPSARTVLLKTVDARGLVFYTSQMSRKAQQLAENPRAALCLFWQPLMEQVLIEGVVEQVSDAEADAYWATRPRMSQIGAWASSQSRRLERRSLLNRRVIKYAARFVEKTVPRPPYWSGFRLLPDRMEFWRRCAFRLHERVLYEREQEIWRRCLLCP